MANSMIKEKVNSPKNMVLARLECVQVRINNVQHADKTLKAMARNERIIGKALDKKVIIQNREDFNFGRQIKKSYLEKDEKSWQKGNYQAVVQKLNKANKPNVARAYRPSSAITF